MILTIGSLFCVGMLGCFSLRPSFRGSSAFELQEKYARSLENKLVDLLEPVTGIGNIHASVQAEIRHQNITQTLFDFKKATRTVVHEKGPVLMAQSVSVLINGKDKDKFASYQNLIQGAIGFDPERGDRLAVEILPFVKVPLWTLGLSPVYLVRIGAVLFLLILLGIFWLAKEALPKRREKLYYLPDKNLWQKAEEFPAEQTAEFLKKKEAEVSAFILNRLTTQKSQEIFYFFPDGYKNQASLHLDHLERLNDFDQFFLLQRAEKVLREMLSKVPEKQKNDFNQFQYWKNEEIQNLLHYVHKNDFVKALQTANPAVQQAFMQNIPPALWQEFIRQMRTNPCSKNESDLAQKKILHLAMLLKKAR